MKIMKEACDEFHELPMKRSRMQDSVCRMTINHQFFTGTVSLNNFLVKKKCVAKENLKT